MLDEKYISKLTDNFGCKILINESMKKHTTFKIGGFVDAFIMIPSKLAMIDILKYCHSNNLDVYIIGNGSNILVDDRGIKGVCVKYVCSSIKIISSDEDGSILKCSGGISLSSVCHFAMEHSLSGLEFAWGIPGTLGGAVYMNAGAYGSQISDIYLKSEHIDSEGNCKYFDTSSINFSYRKSQYSNKKLFIESVYLKLKKGKKDDIKNTMSDYMKKRNEKQPLDLPSAGSVFKRPEGYFAGKLIEECGLKGLTIGGAQVSEKHAGFIVNINDASCSDVTALIKKIQAEVYNQKGVKLECEIMKL